MSITGTRCRPGSSSACAASQEERTSGSVRSSAKGPTRTEREPSVHASAATERPPGSAHVVERPCTAATQRGEGPVGAGAAALAREHEEVDVGVAVEARGGDVVPQSPADQRGIRRESPAT